jgi:hypothetical protein
VRLYPTKQNGSCFPYALLSMGCFFGFYQAFIRVDADIVPDVSKQRSFKGELQQQCKYRLGTGEAYPRLLLWACLPLILSTVAHE